MKDSLMLLLNKVGAHIASGAAGRVAGVGSALLTWGCFSCRWTPLLLFCTLLLLLRRCIVSLVSQHPAATGLEAPEMKRAESDSSSGSAVDEGDFDIWQRAQTYFKGTMS